MKPKGLCKSIKTHLNEKSIVPGCNYHTTWQSNKAMRFILVSISGNTAMLTTREGKSFTTDIDDLIFITSPYNVMKALEIIIDQTIKPISK